MKNAICNTRIVETPHVIEWPGYLSIIRQAELENFIYLTIQAFLLLPLANATSKMTTARVLIICKTVLTIGIEDTEMSLLSKMQVRRNS